MTVEKIYWDSDCFLAHLQSEKDKAEKCDGVLQKAGRGEVLIVSSALTLAEVLWMRGAPRLPREKAELAQKFIRRSMIRIYNVSWKIAESAQIYVWDNDVSPKDAIHAATAIHLGADALETFDAGLIAKSGVLGSPILLIREPEEPLQRSFHLAKPAENPI